MYFQGKEDFNVVLLRPNYKFKNRVEELQKKIDQLEKQKNLAK